MAKKTIRKVRRKRDKGLQQAAPGTGGWWPLVREPFSGAWQKNITLDRTTMLAFTTVYACITLISSDIAKMRVRLMKFLTPEGIWQELIGNASPFLAVLRKPNRYQNRLQFYASWLISKLAWGNTYVLKERDDARGIVTAMYVLDPSRVIPLVADDGGVYYELKKDLLAQIDVEKLIVPASEIIHDRMNCLFHPLVGISPLFAAGLAASQGIKIQGNSASFFENGSHPGGVLTAPGAISDETAGRLKAYWDTNFTGENAGKVAVLGDGLKYEAMAFNARDSQMVEQLKLSAENVCSAFHMPPYKVQVGQMPSGATTEQLNQIYYSDCLQSLIESLELCLDEGLELPPTLGTEFDLLALLRMDTTARYEAINKAIAGGWLAPNEGRRREDYLPAKGGDSPMMQQQNYSLAALAERDSDKPFAKPAPAVPAVTPGNEPPPNPDEPPDEEDEDTKEFFDVLLRGFDLEAA